MNKSLQCVSIHPAGAEETAGGSGRMFPEISKRFDQTFSGFKSKVLLNTAPQARCPTDRKCYLLRIDGLTISLARCDGRELLPFGTPIKASRPAAPQPQNPHFIWKNDLEDACDKRLMLLI
ncbi:hypothetical protein [Variovorax rhizosphaerae]|uniref:Uncharacterized protein n=1 Tax=Variovorax rhizosphaerae TaxID=1836200 RepID=A0ABU8WET2_9BURK